MIKKVVSHIVAIVEALIIPSAAFGIYALIGASEETDRCSEHFNTAFKENCHEVFEEN